MWSNILKKYAIFVTFIHSKWKNRTAFSQKEQNNENKHKGKEMKNVITHDFLSSNYPGRRRQNIDEHIHSSRSPSQLLPAMIIHDDDYTYMIRTESESSLSNLHSSGNSSSLKRKAPISLCIRSSRFAVISWYEVSIRKSSNSIQNPTKGSCSFLVMISKSVESQIK